jgi:hypothetical protein
MADKPTEKKGGDKKPAAAPSQSLEQKLFVFVGVCVLLLLIVVPAVFSFFHIDSASVFNMHNIKELFITIVSETFVFITFAAVFLSLVFFVGLSYAKSKHNQVMDFWKRNVASQMPGVINTTTSNPNSAVIGQIVLPGSGTAGGQAMVHGPEAQAGNSVWLEVESKINSVNPSDWRLAILEADILLFEMLEQMGLPGQNLGDKLKAADSSFFNSLNEAWQAHKVRNIIAHQGAGYQLSYNEAKKTVDLYRRVFEEFYFI